MVYLINSRWTNAIAVEANLDAKRPPEIQRDLGELLRQLREARQISMAAAAVLLGMSKNQLWKYERGDDRMRIDILQRFATLYGVAVHELVRLASERGTSADREVLIRLQAGLRLLASLPPGQLRPLAAIVQQLLQGMDDTTPAERPRLIEEEGPEPASRVARVGAAARRALAAAA
jgi:transcriptional regulator with XRE-family HTH domain